MHSHFDAATTHDVTEDTGVFETFQKDIESVKLPLESPEIFLPDNDTLFNVKERLKTKEIGNFIREKILICKT